MIAICFFLTAFGHLPSSWARRSDIHRHVQLNTSRSDLQELLAADTPEFREAVLKGFDMREPPSSHAHWRDCLMPYRPQGRCGSCWVFSYSRAFAERLCILTKGKVKAYPSFEQLNECTTSDGDKRCSGSSKDAASFYFSQFGAVADAHLPYQAVKDRKKQKCPMQDMHQNMNRGRYEDSDTLCSKDAFPVLFRSVRQARNEIRRFISSPLAMMRELFYNGPIYVSSSQRKRGHGVVLHGWSTDEDGDFMWIIANSQGGRASGTSNTERTLSVFVPAGEPEIDGAEDAAEFDDDDDGDSLLEIGHLGDPNKRWYLMKGNVELYDKTLKKNRKKFGLTDFTAKGILNNKQHGSLSDYTWRSYNPNTDEFGDIPWHIEKAQAVRPDFLAADLSQYSAEPVVSTSDGKSGLSIRYKVPKNRSPNDWFGLFPLKDTQPLVQQRFPFDRTKGSRDWCPKADALEGSHDLSDVAFGDYSLRVFLDYADPADWFDTPESNIMAAHSQVSRVDFSYTSSGITILATDDGWGVCNSKVMLDILFDGWDPKTGESITPSDAKKSNICNDNPRILPVCVDFCKNLWPDKKQALTKAALLKR